MPDSSKNASGPFGISLKKGRLRPQAINLASSRRVRECGDGPLRLEEGRLRDVNAWLFRRPHQATLTKGNATAKGSWDIFTPS